MLPKLQQLPHLPQPVVLWPSLLSCLADSLGRVSHYCVLSFATALFPWVLAASVAVLCLTGPFLCLYVSNVVLHNFTCQQLNFKIKLMISDDGDLLGAIKVRYVHLFCFGFPSLFFKDSCLYMYLCEHMLYMWGGCRGQKVSYLQELKL